MLRPFRREDAATYSAWLQDAALRDCIGEEPRTVAQILAWQQDLTERPHAIELMIEHRWTGELLGDVGTPDVLAREPRWGTLIARPEHRRAGHGREAFRLFAGLLGSVGVRHLYADIFASNVDSLRAHRRLGFVDIGTWIDAEGRVNVVLKVDL